MFFQKVHMYILLFLKSKVVHLQPYIYSGLALDNNIDKNNNEIFESFIIRQFIQ